MKKLSFIFLIPLLFLSCEKDEDTPKGLVSFAELPAYADGAITFQAQIEFSEPGKEVPIEFIVYEGDTELISDEAPAAANPDGQDLFWETGTVTLTLNPLDAFYGKTLTVHLDPDNKVTADEYTSAQEVETWKVESVPIPQQVEESE